MFYALVMLVTVNGHADRFVIDQLANNQDCAAALRQAKPTRVYRGDGVHVAVTFRCEATRIVKGAR